MALSGKQTFHCLCRHSSHGQLPQCQRPSRWLRTPVEASWLSPGSPPVRLTFAERCWSPGRQPASPPWRLALERTKPQLPRDTALRTHIGARTLPKTVRLLPGGITAVPATSHAPKRGEMVVVMASPCRGAMGWLCPTLAARKGYARGVYRGAESGQRAGAGLLRHGG